jgi:hypothetical protein
MLTRALRPLLRLLFALFTLFTLAVARRADASPWFGWGDSKVEDKWEDGDLDEEDLIAVGTQGHRAPTSDLSSRSWVSLSGFFQELPTGKREVGGLVVVGLAFDKIAAGPVHHIGDPPKPVAPPPPPPTLPTAESASASVRVRVTPKVARAAVAAALRASGIGVDDARIDEMVARARKSAALPETRLRALRVLGNNEQANTLATSQTYYDTAAANLSLEARLTWRLDRLVYADDEPTLERVRLETQEARARVTTHVLQVLFAWQRAELELASAQAGSREEMDALLRELEADTITAGWFERWRARTHGEN